MMLRRYVGRATGRRRKPKKSIWWIFSGFFLLYGITLMSLLVLNPTDIRPPNEKGSTSPSVMPDSTTPTSSELLGTIFWR